MNNPVQLLVGDCRETLATLPAGSIQAAITSPPYYGLRAYGTEPLVWGGDSACHHVWGAFLPCKHPGQVQQTKDRGRGKDSTAAADGQTAPSGQYCVDCGAWRGELGQEPTLDCGGWVTGTECGACFVGHLVEVFRAVRRVLRADGVCLINLGDSYVGGGGYAPNAPSNQDGKSINGRANARGPRNVTNWKRKNVGTHYRLRADLTDEQIGYVLSELAKAGKFGKVR